MLGTREVSYLTLAVPSYPRQALKQPGSFMTPIREVESEVRGNGEAKFLLLLFKNSSLSRVLGSTLKS